MRESGPAWYALCMESSASYVWMADLASTLGRRFGDGLTLVRDGNCARWNYAGQAAVVALRPEGTLDATFVESPGYDAATATQARCVYRRAAGAAYTLTPEGCSRMVADMTDFFSGMREPRFAFIDARAE
jgi:hypothetical protein